MSRRRTVICREFDGRCFWCGRMTVLASPMRGRTVQPDTATVDHLFTRRERARRRAMAEADMPRHVLACYACNNERGAATLDEWVPRLPCPDRREAVSYVLSRLGYYLDAGGGAP